MKINLRKIEPTDLPYLYQWENDSSAWADGNNHNPLSQKDLRDYITSSTGDIYRDGQLRLIIEDVRDQELEVSKQTLGCADLFDFDARNRKAAIGLYVAPEARGRGVGKAAIQALEEYAFTHLDLRLIYAVIATNNNACAELFRALGYVPSSVLKAWTLESDAIIWQKQKK